MERGPLTSRLPASDLLATFSGFGDGVVTTDANGIVTFLNPIAELVTGYSRQEADGCPSSEIIRLFSESMKPVPSPIEVVIREGTPTEYHNHNFLKTKAGEAVPVAHCAAPLKNQAGELLGTLFVFHPSQPLNEVAPSDLRIELIARATNDVVWDWDLGADHIWWNDAVYTLFGYTPEEVGNSIGWYFSHIHPDDRQRVIDNIEQAKAERRYWESEYRFRASSGVYGVVLERGYVLRDSSDRPVRMVAAMMDVTARREAQQELTQMNAELEKRVEERTHELKQANRELESFSYSVSHDLREPLRNIIFLTKLVQQDTNNQFDDETRKNISDVLGAADKMSGLIEDLLQYSRISRSLMHLEAVDLSAIANEVTAGLSASYKQNPISVTVEPGMTAQADPLLVQVLLQNLISNAFKFSSKTPGASIHVGWKEIRGERVFYVADNGAGFDPAQAHHLFMPFQRLHSNEEFPGTGIGLANVQRIVRRHGGRIWAEGRPGEGATFYFTL